MTTPDLFHAFLQQVASSPSSPAEDRVRVVEKALLDGRLDTPTTNVLAPSPRYAALRHGASGAVHRGIARLLKTAVRALYLSPVLIAVKVALNRVDRAASDLVTVGFVSLVVAFFVLLNLYIVWSLVHWSRRGADRCSLVLPVSASGKDTLGLFEERARGAQAVTLGAVMGDLIRVRGMVAPLDAHHAATRIVSDAWATDALDSWRLTEATDFVVRPSEGPAVVVRCESAPLVIGRPERGRRAPRELASTEAGLRLAASGGLAEESVWVLGLDAGDEVEVVAAVAAVLPDLRHVDIAGTIRSAAPEGQTDGSAYRGAAPEGGFLVTSRPDQPVLIRRC